MGELNPMHKKQVLLFYCVECEELARKVAAHSQLITLQSINWRSFDDGFPNLYINNAHDIRGQHVAFLASFSSPAVIFEQLSVIYNLPRLFVASFTLVLPFFPTGSFERMEEEGDVATAFTMARILSNIPISRGGPTSVVIYDIHALQERFYFGDHVLPLFETGIPLLKQRLHQLPDAEKIVVAFPDDGAWKRFHKLLDHFPTVICTKVREGDKRIVRLKEGNPADCHVVIVDDLVQSGGTLIECQKVLLAHGAAKVSAYVTHGVFPKSSWERFTGKEGGRDSEKGFAYFWITDSCPNTVKAIENRAPFEVLSLAGSIADALQI
ncbi:phosphoribosyl diphosphate synthase 4 [Hibiscus trionum]|uniref:ribose-phosphate diphosphokinase n=1 Tax=Hibiscus trionum TaxID=183268 RepID=A0A9W7M5U6_HIBTR|nr:phosphoribosyl diphosphate synthase 4 [Hibiscus trionum]